LESNPIEFESDQSYAHPPQIGIRGEVLSTNSGVSFNLDLVSPNLISQLNVNVISSQTGNAVVTETKTEVLEANEIRTDNLDVGQSYTLQVQAVDGAGQVLSEATADFTYEPAAAVLAIVSVQPPTDERPAYLVEVNPTNLEAAVKYQAWLIASGQQGSGSQLPVDNTTVIVPVGGPLLIPVETLQTGQYSAVAQALDAADTVLAQAPASEPFLYTRPSALELFIRRFGETRLAIVSTTLICVAVFAVAVVFGGIMILRRSTQPKPVVLVLPERKISAPAALSRSDPQSERPVERPRRPPPEPISEPVSEPRLSASRFDRTQLPPEAFSDSAPSSPSIVVPPERSTPLPKACVRGKEPGDAAGISAQVIRSPFSIGRREGNDLVIRVSNRSGMSGRHATITFSGGRFYIQDDFSSFGTKVNDERLQPGIPKPLDDGALVALGPSVVIQFLTGDSCSQ
jgi:hypothetical protein